MVGNSAKVRASVSVFLWSGYGQTKVTVMAGLA